MKRLKVRIKKKFQRGINKRFSYNHFRQELDNVVRNRTKCPLCRAYNKCRRCPFKRFAKTKLNDGCFIWMKEVIPDLRKNMYVNDVYVAADVQDIGKAKKLLEEFRKIRKKYIEYY